MDKIQKNYLDRIVSMSTFYLTDYNVKNYKLTSYIDLLLKCKESFNYVGDTFYRFKNLPTAMDLFIVGKKLWKDKKYNSNDSFKFNNNYYSIIESFNNKHSYKG